jgi:hypothetical protein
VPGVEPGIVVRVEDLAGVVDQASGGFFEPVCFLADVGDRGRRDGAALEWARGSAAAGCAVGAETLRLGVTSIPVEHVTVGLDLDRAG